MFLFIFYVFLSLIAIFLSCQMYETVGLEKQKMCTVFPENVTDSTPTSLFTLVFVLAASRGTFRLTLFFFWFFVLVHEVNKTRWWGSMRMNVATLFIKMTSSLARVREALPFHFCPSFFFSSFSVEMGICFHDPKP